MTVNVNRIVCKIFHNKNKFKEVVTILRNSVTKKVLFFIWNETTQKYFFFALFYFTCILSKLTNLILVEKRSVRFWRFKTIGEIIQYRRCTHWLICNLQLHHVMSGYTFSKPCSKLAEFLLAFWVMKKKTQLNTLRINIDVRVFTWSCLQMCEGTDRGVRMNLIAKL